MVKVMNFSGTGGSGSSQGMRPRSNHTSSPGRRGVVVVPVLVLVLLAVAAPGWGSDFQAGKLRFEDYVPADCYLFGSFEGLARCDAAMDSLGIYKMWMEPEVQEFFRGMLEMIHQQMAPNPEIPFQEIRGALQGRVGFAVGDSTLVHMLVPVPSFVVSLDMGNHRQEFQEMFRHCLQEAGAHGLAPAGSFDYQGVTIHNLAVPEARRTHLCYTFLDNLFVMGLNKYYLQRLVDNYKRGTAGLSKQPSYQRSLSKVQASPNLCSLFLNFDGIKSKFEALAPPELAEIAEVLGVHNVHSLYWASALSAPGTREILYLDAPGEKKGLLKVLSPGPVSKDAVKFAPYNTVFFLTANLDLNGAIDEVLQICDVAWPQAREHFNHARKEFQEEAGFDFKSDLLGSLGNGISISVSLPSTGGLIPEILATIDLENSSRFESCLETLLSRSGGALNKMEYKPPSGEKRTIKYLTLPGSAPFSPAYIIDGNTFYLAGAPLVLKEAIRMRGEGGKSLADNPTYQAVASRLSGSPSMFEFIDLPRGLSMLYATGAPFLQMAQGEIQKAGLPIDLALLPTTESLTRHLTGVGSAYVSDQDGILCESFSPLGTAGVLAVLAKVVNSIEGVPDVPRRIIAMRGPGWLPAETAPAPTPEGKPGGTLKASPQLFRHSFDLHQQGRYDEAIAGFKKCAEAGYFTATSYYNIACGYSLKNDPDQAFQWLRKALDSGFDNIDLVRSDPDLDNIRQDPRFNQLLDGI